MSAVILVSGGIDSSLVSLLVAEQGTKTFPLFVDYGQLACKRELESCRNIHKQLGLPSPRVARIPGFGRLVPSGLTSQSFDINKDAFLPNRNLLFLLVAASYAYSKQADTIGIGLLDEKAHIFPDQTAAFLNKAAELIKISLDHEIRIVAPLIELPKAAVIRLAKEKGIMGTYSCHSGNERPCGRCISCVEILKSQS
jgi:7-cyano-7-deazaguanine synthase